MAGMPLVALLGPIILGATIAIRNRDGAIDVIFGG
jgi:hypothetical protein